MYYYTILQTPINAAYVSLGSLLLIRIDHPTKVVDLMSQPQYTQAILHIIAAERQLCNLFDCFPLTIEMNILFTGFREAKAGYTESQHHLFLL